MATYIDNVSGTSDGSAAVTTQATAAQNVTTGNTLVVFVRHHDGDMTVSVSDTASNTWVGPVQANTTVGTSNRRGHAFYCVGATGNASNVVTASFSGEVTYATVVCLQYSGIGTFANSYADTSSNDSAVEAVGISASATGAGVLVSAMLLIFSDASVPTNAGSSSTRRYSQQYHLAVDEIIAATSGTYTTEYTEAADWASLGNIALLFNDTGGGSIVPHAMANYRMRAA